jgi:hypothetical protein
MRGAVYVRVSGHRLDQGHSLSEGFGCDRNGFELVFLQELAALAMPAQECLWLDDEQRLLPSADHPGQ